MSQDRDPIKWVKTSQRVEARYLAGTGVHAVGKVIAYTDAPTVVIETDDGRQVSWRADMVEVLEPADDLTYRVGTHNPRNIYLGDEPVGVMFDPEAAPVVVAALNAAVAERRMEAPLPEWERDLLAKGSCPSVRVTNEPHGLSHDTRTKIAAFLAAGNPVSAAATAMEAGLSREAAVSYVESMSESYLAAHGDKREPRTFTADGPEPPAGVNIIEDEGPDWGDMKYLLRVGDLWCWSPSRELVPPDHSTPVLWERAARQAAGPLREVV